MTADGLYFNLSEDEYHAVHALSASGIKHLLISNPDFWFRSPMNPLRRDEPTDAMTIGKAFHKRILEGKELFNESYALTFQEPHDCLKTVDDIKERLRELAVDTKGCKTKSDFIARLKDVDQDAVLYSDLLDAYMMLHAGKEFISADLLSSIEVAAAMIEKNPALSKCFKGGYPEVSVIWTEDGVRFKARFDYLKPRAVIDLKTFANPLNKPIDSAIYSAMASGKYHIQAAFYLRAVKAAQSAARPKDFTGEDKWLEAFTDCKEHDFFFVFQAKGIAPLARGKKFNRGSLWSCGEVAIEEAVRRYKECMATFGPDIPWIDSTEIDEFDDSLFPTYTTEL
jgi:PDDEXK-like domain of unknown function (DUF3799)